MHCSWKEFFLLPSLIRLYLSHDYRLKGEGSFGQSRWLENGLVLVGWLQKLLFLVVCYVYEGSRGLRGSRGYVFTRVQDIVTP